MKKVKGIIIMASSFLFLCGITCGVAIMCENTNNDNSIIISADDCVYNDLIYFINDDDTITIKGPMEDADLNDVIIPDEIEGKKVTCIGQKAFYDYRSMVTLHLGKNITSIGDYAFYNTKLEKVTVSDNIQDIAENAFNNTEINKLIVPDSVTHVPAKLYFNKSLTEFSVENGNKYYSNDDQGVLYNSDKSTLIKFPANSTVLTYEMKDSTTSIEPEAFRKSTIHMIYIGDHVRSIGEYCFYECNNLSNVILGKSVDCIGDYAFAADPVHSPNIFNQLQVSSNISSLGKCAFENANILKLVISDSVESMPDTFYCNNALTEIYVTEDNKNYSSDDQGVLYNCNKSVLIKFPPKSDVCSYLVNDNTISIEKEAFKSCNLTDVATGNNVEIIGDGSFADCHKLSSVVLGKNVKTIGDYAFASTDPGNRVNFAEIKILSGNISDIDIHSFQYADISTLTVCDSVKSIPHDLCFNYALTEINVDENNKNFSSDKGVLYNADKSNLIKFPVNSSLNTYVVNDNTILIENEAFYCCKNLSEITISDNVQAIGNSCFCECASLSDVTLGKNVVSIGDCSFSCSDINNPLNLNQLTLSDNIEMIGEYSFEQSTVSKINVPASVRSIPSELYNIRGLTEIVVAEDNKAYSSDKGVLYNADKSKLIKCPQLSPLRTYNVSDNTSSIETSAFTDTNVQTIFIPACVKTIGDNAFANSSLKTIKGISGSYAQTYATDNEYTFTPVDPSATSVTTTKEDETTTTAVSTSKKGIYSSTTTPTTQKDNTSSTTSTDKPKINYDVNGDGKINIMDVMILKKYILNALD